jgi:glycerol uptake facilitator-like aquaporin
MDGDWIRFGFVWIFIVGPIVGGFIALLFVNNLYKKMYDNKLKNAI